MLPPNHVESNAKWHGKWNGHSDHIFVHLGDLEITPPSITWRSIQGSCRGYTGLIWGLIRGLCSRLPRIVLSAER